MVRRRQRHLAERSTYIGRDVCGSPKSGVPAPTHVYGQKVGTTCLAGSRSASWLVPAAAGSITMHCCRSRVPPAETGADRTAAAGEAMATVAAAKPATADRTIDILFISACLHDGRKKQLFDLATPCTRRAAPPPARGPHTWPAGLRWRTDVALAAPAQLAPQHQGRLYRRLSRSVDQHH